MTSLELIELRDAVKSSFEQQSALHSVSGSEASAAHPSPTLALPPQNPMILPAGWLEGDGDEEEQKSAPDRVSTEPRHRRPQYEPGSVQAAQPGPFALVYSGPYFTPRTCCCTNKHVAGVCTKVIPSPLPSCSRDQDHFVDFFMVEYNGGMANMRRYPAP